MGTWKSCAQKSVNITNDGFCPTDDKPNHKCPKGFKPVLLDMLNHNATLHTEVKSFEDCCDKCKHDSDCKGVEFNADADHCFTSKTGHHCTVKQGKAWLSCAKDG